MISDRLAGQQALETSLCLSHSASVPRHAQLLSPSTYFCLTDVKTTYLSQEANPSFVGSRAYMSRAGLLTSKLRLSSWDFYLERISRWLIQAAHSVPEPSQWNLFPPLDLPTWVWKSYDFVVMDENGLMILHVMLVKADSTCIKHLFIPHHSIILRLNKNGEEDRQF